MTTNVLIFESDTTFANAVQEELERIDCNVYLVEDANAGLRLASTIRPDLILVSVELPRGNGFNICNRLKRDTPSVPVIVLSSAATEQEFANHKKLPTAADDYIRKPVAADRLVARLRTRSPLAPDVARQTQSMEVSFEDESLPVAAEVGDAEEEIDEAVLEEADYANEPEQTPNAQLVDEGTVDMPAPSEAEPAFAAPMPFVEAAKPSEEDEPGMFQGSVQQLMPAYDDELLPPEDDERTVIRLPGFAAMALRAAGIGPAEEEKAPKAAAIPPPTPSAPFSPVYSPAYSPPPAASTPLPPAAPAFGAPPSAGANSAAPSFGVPPPKTAPSFGVPPPVAPPAAATPLPPPVAPPAAAAPLPPPAAPPAAATPLPPPVAPPAAAPPKTTPPARKSTLLGALPAPKIPPPPPGDRASSMPPSLPLPPMSAPPATLPTPQAPPAAQAISKPTPPPMRAAVPTLPIPPPVAPPAPLPPPAAPISSPPVTPAQTPAPAPSAMSQASSPSMSVSQLMTRPSAPPSQRAQSADSVPPPESVDTAEADRLRADIEKMRAELHKTQADAGRLSGELSASQARIAWLEGELSSANDSVGEVGRLKREVDDLRGRLSSAGKIGSTSGRELLELRETLNKKDKELISVREQLSQRDKDVLALRERELLLEREKADQNEKMLALLQEKEAAEQRERQAEEEFSDLKRKTEADLKAQENALNIERDRALQALVAKHTEKLARLEMEHEQAVAGLEAKVAQAESALSDKTRELSETKADLEAKLSVCTHERDSFRGESERLAVDLAMEQATLAKIRMQWKDSKHSLGEAKQALASALAFIEAAEKRAIE